MRDFCMDLSKIAASIVTDIMGSTLTVQTYYSSDGNSIIMEFNGYPLYGSRKTGKVFVQYPRSTFNIRRRNIEYKPIYQSECRYYQDYIGYPFAHPHIFNDGHPCWDYRRRERAVDFITNIIETLTMENVTKDSITIGKCASGVMGVGYDALRTAKAQETRILKKLKCKPIIKDRIKLESYVNKRWWSKITILMRSM